METEVKEIVYSVRPRICCSNRSWRLSMRSLANRGLYLPCPTSKTFCTFQPQQDGFSCGLYVAYSAKCWPTIVVCLLPLFLAMHRLITPGKCQKNPQVLCRAFRSCPPHSRGSGRPARHGDVHPYLSSLIDSKVLLHLQRSVPAAPPGLCLCLTATARVVADLPK